MSSRSYSAIAVVAVSTLVSAVAACTGALSASPAGSEYSNPPGGSGGAGGGNIAAEGLPCTIADTLATYCTGCHSNPPVGGAPIPLVTYDDLAAPSPDGGTYAGRSILRMKDAASPMPPAPGGLVPAAAISEMESWVLSGMPKGNCGGGGSGATGGGGGGTGGAPPQTGIPCDVAAALVPCIGCHGYVLSGGAPMSLVTYAQLTAASPKGGTYADRCVVRMTDAVKPMPPSPAAPAPAADVQTLQAWIASGTPMGDCGQGGGGGGGPNPYDTPDTCTSTIYWGGGEEDWGPYPKEAMHPGDKCIDCHDHPGNYGVEDMGPKMFLAGTVYPTAHEFDECFGVDGTQSPIQVVVTDASGAVFTLSPNESGNFWIRKSPGKNVVFPIYAKVVANGQERAMSQAVDTGDCNACHTLAGTQEAPGRIMAP